jgi:hypothetical protein
MKANISKHLTPYGVYHFAFFILQFSLFIFDLALRFAFWYNRLTPCDLRLTAFYYDF